MRGLLFTGGEAPVKKSSTALVGSTNDCVVVAADSGLRIAEDWGLSPDWIVGDMDSLDNPERLQRYPQECILRHKQAKDLTDTELGLQLLHDQGIQDITLIGGGGGRLDHLIAILSLFSRAVYPWRWILPNECVWAVDAQVPVLRTLSLALHEASLVSVFSVSHALCRMHASGLRWPLDAVDWGGGACSISNQSTSPDVRFEAVSGRFIVVAPLEAVQSREARS